MRKEGYTIAATLAVIRVKSVSRDRNRALKVFYINTGSNVLFFLHKNELLIV